ncbi:hypothetical protein [Legionella sp. 16cNR16C]|nr:hypothetical protein [Legionella sp. 16cNR16C]
MRPYIKITLMIKSYQNQQLRKTAFMGLSVLLIEVEHVHQQYL